MSDTTEQVVYAGRRTLRSGKIGHAYEGTDGALRYYSAPLTIGTFVGSRIEITHPDGEATTYYAKGLQAPRVVGFDTEIDPAKMLLWQTADRAAYQVKADADATKRAAKRADRLEGMIDQLADAGAGLNNHERAAFARYVADRIRGV